METQNWTDDAREKLLLPPTPGTFNNREELITYVREFGASQGYVVTIKKSKRDRRVILGCDRGGVYRNRHKVEEKKRKRKASSRLINCPFEAIGRKDDDEWVLTVKHGEHNHEALRDMSEHPYSRRFTEEEVTQIKLMTEAGVKPRQVLKALKQNNPELQSTPRHLYNVKAKIRQGNFTAKTFKPWRPNNSPTVFTPSESSIQHNHPVKVLNLIGGKFLESKACAFINVVNPATQELVSQVPLTTYDEFKAAVSAAKQAFPIWKDTPVTVRQRIMFKFQELIRRDIDKLAISVATEQGKTLKGAKGDVLRGLEVVEHACGMATLQMGEFAPNASNGIDTYCTREPLGVCAGICPFNFPAMISLWMFPIAVTCGNTFILKPSEVNPGASMIIAELAIEAGLPDGVLNIVHGTNDIVNQICDDDDVKAISLISSDIDGMYTYARAAARGKHVQSTLGVKNYAVVMPDASIDATLDALVSAGFGTAGQRSMALNTVIFVGGSRSWEEGLVRRAKALKVTAGKEPGADLGPVISKEAKDHICRLVQNGVESGARLILDGRHIVVPRYERGNFVGPTILCDVTTSMNCYKEEMSGPVLLCLQVDKLEEAVTIVNRQKNGNGASIFTTSGVAARKFQNKVDTDLVGVNVPVPIPLPFSSFDGSKASISGDLNFHGKAGVQFYTKIKIVAQQWRDLPAQRLLLPAPQIPETERRQTPPQVQPPTYGSDIPNLEVSPATPSASERYIASQNALISLPPLSEGGSPNLTPLSSTSQTIVRELSSHGRSAEMPSRSERASINQEISLAMPPAIEGHNLHDHMTSSSYTPQTSKREHKTQKFQSGDSLSLKSPRTGSDLSTHNRTYMPPSAFGIKPMASTSLRMDISLDHDSDISIPTSHRNGILSLTSGGKDNMGLNLHRTDINTHPTFGCNYGPTASVMADSAGISNSGGVYMLPLEAGIDLMPTRTSAVMHPASERKYLQTSYRNDMVQSHGTGSMPSTTEKMSIPSAVQKNDELPTAFERFGQRISDSAAVYMGEYSGHGASSTSQRP